MCGICGILSINSNCDDFPRKGDVAGMVKRLRRRGPDATGIYAAGPIVLGASRLAIIDLSPEAGQPMIGDNGDYVIVFNGEIYNYIELRKELEKEGTRFSTKSDTEVLLKLYMKKGAACLGDLRGMFAFAVWNKRTRSLFLARDRIGEKPLVYYHRNGVFAFASDIKALLSLPWIPREVDPIAIHHGLHYYGVPAPFSAFKHIRKLPPAKQMTVSKEGISLRTYWRPQYPGDDIIDNPRDCVDAINECLDETVRIMSRSDVPLGAMLSGGIDSSAVVASLSTHCDRFATFCVGHQTKGGSTEFQPARIVAELFRTKHHELTFTQEDLPVVSEVLRRYSEPIASFLPMHAQALSALIKKNVTVALTGHGGDEIFGGYGEHRLLMKYDRRIKLWKFLEDWGVGKLAKLSPVRSIRKSRSKYSKLRDVSKGRRWAAEMRLEHARAFCQTVYSDRMKSLCEDCDPCRLFIEALEDYDAPNLFDGFMYEHLILGAQHAIVDIPDISGMANSLEYRSPFLDVKMVELAMRIPPHIKVNLKLGDSGGKWILREALRRRLPEEIVKMKKVGFGSSIPYEQWVLGDWRDFMLEKFDSPALMDSGLFQPQKLKVMYHAATMGRPAPLQLLWGIAMVSAWLEEFF